jgi:1-acyl-sn-glycerol-3-phosphate acyltransferase
MRTRERAGVARRVEELIAALAPGGTVEPGRRLADAGFDSLAYAELALALEESFGVKLADAHLAYLETAAAIGGAVEALQARRAGPRIPRGIGRYQSLAERVLGPVLTGWYDVRMTGREHVPASGAAIVCANHNSLLDIPFLTMAVPREIWFMAKAELFASGFSSGFFRALGGFSVRRQVADLRAVDTALAVLEQDRVLGMFPEGTRSPEALLPFLPGAAWIGLVRGAPLVPVAITGAGESLPRGRVIPKRTRVRVAFGEAIEVEREPDPARRAARAGELTSELRRRIVALSEGDSGAVR